MNAAHPEACPDIVKLAGMLGLGLSSEAEKLMVSTDDTVEQILIWIEDCPTCTLNLETLEEWQEEVGYPDFAIVAHERNRAHELWAELENVPAEELAQSVSQKHHFWAMAQLMSRKSIPSLRESSERGLALARLGLLLSERLDTDVYTPCLVSDLVARAWAFLGNALRVRSEHALANSAFLQAEKYLRTGTGSSRTHAIVLDLLGSLRKDQRRLEEAALALNAAAQLYENSGDTTSTGKVHLNLGLLSELQGDLQGAVAHLTQAQSLIEPAADQFLYGLCHQHLLYYLTEAECFEEAELRLPLVRRAWEGQNFEWNSLFVKWCETRILTGTARFQEAERALTELASGFAELGHRLGVGTAKLELACLLATQGRLAETKMLALESCEILVSCGIEREALAALEVLRQAIRSDELSEEVVRHVSKFIIRSQRDPGAKFKA